MKNSYCKNQIILFNYFSLGLILFISSYIVDIVKKTERSFGYWFVT